MGMGWSGSSGVYSLLFGLEIGSESGKRGSLVSLGLGDVLRQIVVASLLVGEADLLPLLLLVGCPSAASMEDAFALPAAAGTSGRSRLLFLAAVLSPVPVTGLAAGPRVPVPYRDGLSFAASILALSAAP